MSKKRIYVTEENKEIIQKMLDEVHGRSYKHHFTPNCILKMALEANKRLSILPKRLWKGMGFYFDASERKCNAHTYQYDADAVCLKWSPKGWYIVSLRRDKFFPDQKPEKYFCLSKTEEGELQEKEIKDILFRKLFNF